MKKLICLLTTLLTLGSPVQVTLAQSTQPSTPPQEPTNGLDGLEAFFQFVAALQALIDAINALQGGFGGGPPMRQPRGFPTNPTGPMGTFTEEDLLGLPMPIDEIRALLDEKLDPPTLSNTSSCKIFRPAETKVVGPFILPDDAITSVFMDLPFPKGTVTAREVTLEESTASGGMLPQCTFPGLRIPMSPIPRPPLMINNCTNRESTGLCQPNSPGTKSLGSIQVQFSDSMKRGERNSCRFEYPLIFPDKILFCPATALVHYRFNEDPASGTGEQTDTLITELIQIPSQNLLIFFASIICESDNECLTNALKDIS